MGKKVNYGKDYQIDLSEDRVTVSHFVNGFESCIDINKEDATQIAIGILDAYLISPTEMLGEMVIALGINHPLVVKGMKKIHGIKPEQFSP